MFRYTDEFETDEALSEMMTQSRRCATTTLVLSDTPQSWDECPAEADLLIDLRRGCYDRELIQSVWEFAEIVPGNDPSLWRKDEFGSWIHRLDYARRTSEFGWEIFDPGIGRHAQGVYAMRPMQWESYIRQYETFA